MKYILLVIAFMITPMMASSQYFDLQGHRGARGVLPENSIPGFKRALELGVNTLELDVVVSKDKQVVVSHEPYFSSKICSDPDGNPIGADKEKSLNIYQMNYEEIRKFDSGSRGNDKFPDQEKMSVYKPLLSEVIEVCEKYAEELGRPLPRYNVEIKSVEKEYGIFQPQPAEYVELVYDVVKDIPITRINIQSFDLEILRVWRIKHPEYRIAMLEVKASSPEKAIEKLGFKPHIYSPYYRFLTRKKLVAYHEKDIAVIPWTVNNLKDMKKFYDWGADGIITDYPNIFMENYPDKTR